MGAPPICDRAMFDALSAANFSDVRLRDVADIQGELFQTDS